MVEMFKQGVFANILTNDPDCWWAAIRQLSEFESLDHVELWVEHFPNSEQLSTLKGLLRGLDVVMHGPFVHLSLLSHVSKIVELTAQRFSKAMEVGAALGAKVVTFHAGSFPVFETRASALEKLASRFEPFSNSRSPVATLENMPLKTSGTQKEPLGKVQDLLELRRLLPVARFTLDIGHCIQNGDDFEAFLRNHGDCVHHIHLHDGFCGGKAHRRLGTGELDLTAFLNAVRTSNFSRYISLETIDHDDTLESWRLLQQTVAGRIHHV
jgi:sugar phosphate isomerase/epimerase